jgi:hypothetical protein
LNIELLGTEKRIIAGIPWQERIDTTYLDTFCTSPIDAIGETIY